MARYLYLTFRSFEPSKAMIQQSTERNQLQIDIYITLLHKCGKRKLAQSEHSKAEL